MNDSAPAVTTHSDARGDLLAVELTRLPFDVRRVFIVHGPEHGAERGDHVVPCDQLMVLVRGSVEVTVGSDAAHAGTAVTLDVPGMSVPLPAGHYVRYRLAAPSCVMVLAEQSYQAADRS